MSVVRSKAFGILFNSGSVNSATIGPAAGKLWRIRYVSLFCNAGGTTNRATLNWIRAGENGPAFGSFNQSQFQVTAGLVEIILEPGDGIFLNSGSAAAQFIATLYGSERTL